MGEARERGWTIDPRRAATPPSPTVDLYFRNAMGFGPWRMRAPTVVETDEAVLVARHDAGARVDRDERRRLVYLVDDAIFAGVRDAGLPLGYRAKLWLVDCASARRLLPRADAVVVSAPEVADALPRRLLRPGAEVSVVDPYWIELPEEGPDLGHFDDGRPLRIGFTGAQTHGGSLGFAAAAAAPALAADPRATLHLSAGHRPPRGIDPQRLSRDPAVRWSAYRATLAGRRLHLALYPLPDAPFARARSANKLIEHAVLGAAPLYSETWPRARLAAEAGAGLVLPLRLEDWREAVSALAAAPETARALAARAWALARRLNDPRPQQRLWARLLGLPPPLSGGRGCCRG